MNDNCGVYVVESPNGKLYVGKTAVGFSKRWSNHLYEARHGAQTYLKRAIRKHGTDAFRRVAWYPVSSDELNALEIDLIAYLETWKPENGYNGTMGGDGLVATAEVRAKIGAAHRGKIVTLEQRSRMSAAHKGLKQAPEAIAKTTAANRGKKRDPAIGRKISASHKGVKLSPEHCARISEVRKGKPLPPEHRAAIKAAMNKTEVRAKNTGAFKKGCVPWHTDASRVTDDHRKKWAAALTQHVWTPEQIERRSAAVSLTCHVRWHVNRNQFNPQCSFCTAAATQTTQEAA